MSTGVTAIRLSKCDDSPKAFVNKLLPRSIATVENRLVLLAPPDGPIPSALEQIDVDEDRRSRLLGDAQRLRGRIYVQDGAVDRHELTADGRLETSEDEKSWHLLILDKVGNVSACVWYLSHEPNMPAAGLRVRHCPLARQAFWRDALWGAVESELACARRAGLGYAEVGGWAVTESSRRTSEGLVLALAGYSLGRLLGGTLGITTATVRHCSSTILRRLGGSELRLGERTIPPYHDPRYNCEMELLRFDSRHPNPKYAALVEMLTEKLSNVLVVARHDLRRAAPSYGLEMAAAV
jgi:hypothetical protein